MPRAVTLDKLAFRRLVMCNGSGSSKGSPAGVMEVSKIWRRRNLASCALSLLEAAPGAAVDAAVLVTKASSKSPQAIPSRFKEMVRWLEP